MRKFVIVCAALVAGCQATTPEGCPIYMTEIMQAQTRACVAAYHEEIARQKGGLVTRCTPLSGSVSCATY